jgi:predicted permease
VIPKFRPILRRNGLFLPRLFLQVLLRRTGIPARAARGESDEGICVRDPRATGTGGGFRDLFTCNIYSGIILTNHHLMRIVFRKPQIIIIKGYVVRMENLYPLIRSVAIFFLLVIFIQILKRRGIFDASHLQVFGRLITDLILPITIFSTLAVSKIELQFMNAAGIYLAGSLLISGIAYLICRFFNFSNAVTGSLVILAGFGSTSTIAYPLIIQTYGVASEALTRALIIGEFGSVLPFFTLGVLIVSYFGQKTGNKTNVFLESLKSFFRTPIFLSLLAGLAVSLIPPLSNLMASDFFSAFFAYFDNGFEMLVAITIGLMLRPVKIKEIILYLAITLPLALIFMPLFVYAMATMGHVPLLTREILVIMAAVPSGAIAGVVAERYGCDGPLASMIVVVAFLFSLITLPLLSVILL